MKALDRYLQRVRINKAKKYIRKGDTVLDIGSVDGVMFEALQGIIEKGFGIDPTLTQQIETPLYTLIPGYFPEVSPKGLQYDVITMLAVLEHIPTHLQIELANNCFKHLKPGGRVVITVPSPQVDTILAILTTLKLIDGMSLEEHYGYDPAQTIHLFSAPQFKLVRKQSFQFGLNNLFVFEKNKNAI